MTTFAYGTRVYLRPAKPDDLPLLKHWDEQPHVVAANPNDEWDWEEELKPVAWQEPLIAEVDGRPVGFVQVLNPAIEPTRYWGDAPQGLRAIDIWIGEPQDLGRGYGTRIMQLALRRCFDEPGVQAVLLDPLITNVRAHKFYERLGFRFVEQRKFGQDVCAVYQLDRHTWQCLSTTNLGER